MAKKQQSIPPADAPPEPVVTHGALCDPDPPMAAETPRVGDTVLYHLPSGPNAGAQRAAIVTAIMSIGLDLTVFGATHRDFQGNHAVQGQASALSHVALVGNVLYGNKPGCWSWRGQAPQIVAG